MIETMEKFNDNVNDACLLLKSIYHNKDKILRLSSASGANKASIYYSVSEDLFVFDKQTCDASDTTFRSGNDAMIQLAHMLCYMEVEIKNNFPDYETVIKACRLVLKLDERFGSLTELETNLLISLTTDTLCCIVNRKSELVKRNWGGVFYQSVVKALEVLEEQDDVNDKPNCNGVSVISLPTNR